ncbi:lipocalin family protein [Streptomyces sp. NPDC101455]|uniref:lipocalin family protein n=1 Tax=Streptomyces sp. NPDC101455 TaxID=3366142 RepID=UPI0038053D70
MKRTQRISLGIAGAMAATALLASAVLPSAQAAQRPAAAASQPVNSGIPGQVDPAADLAAQTDTSGDSIYVTSRVKDGGHDYGLLVQVVKIPGGASQLLVSVSDETTGWYKKYTATSDKLTWSREKLDIKAPGITWTGTMQNMSVSAETPWGAIDMQLKNDGPAFQYSSNGITPVYGVVNHHYALPNLTATATFTVDGKTTKAAGTAWLDRQWGPYEGGPNKKFTWLPIHLSNGDTVAVWDIVNGTKENSWATVQHPDGSYEVVEVKPLATKATKFWTSAESGNTYPTRYVVEIPALHARLMVNQTGAVNQELTAQKGDGRVEATGIVHGVIKGQKVTGDTIIEQAGDYTS